MFVASRFTCHSGVALGALLVGLGLAASPAAAQQMNRLARPQVQQPDDTKPKIAPPPAVPGSKPSAAAAPADHPGLDMPPNDALFDSINRGDLAGTKDAISRGADMSARNVLGLTPLELSVDLGRNEISFLLLSLRGADSTGPRVASGAPGPAAPAPKVARAVRARVPAEPRQAAVAPAPGAARNPQLFAGNGGAAVPQAGFLGFGGSRAGQ